MYITEEQFKSTDTNIEKLFEITRSDIVKHENKSLFDRLGGE